MSVTDKYIYDLISLEPTEWDSITQLAAPQNNVSPYEGEIVYLDDGITGTIQTYTVTLVGLNDGRMTGWIPPVAVTNYLSTSDPNIGKMYQVIQCGSKSIFRFVLFPSPQTLTTVVRFTAETSLWVVFAPISTYVETLTVDTTYTNCSDATSGTSALICDWQEVTIDTAVLVKPLQVEPPDRGFKECCYSQIVLADLSDTASYRNDFSSVFFQRQEPATTVSYQIIPLSTGTPVNLLDGTHGVLYPFAPTNTNPDLTYFKVEWRKILNLLGPDTYTIRKQVSIAGLPNENVDSNSFALSAFTVDIANGTVRMDSIMDGTMERIEANFKDSGYQNSLRLPGFFGNAQDKITRDSVVYSSKFNVAYFENQITMSNDPEYIFQTTNIPECVSRELREFLIFGNRIFVSDYNKNNHSYRYELFSVVLEDITNTYPVESRGTTIEITLKERSKSNIKTNC